MCACQLRDIQQQCRRIQYVEEFVTDDVEPAEEDDVVVIEPQSTIPQIFEALLSDGIIDNCSIEIVAHTNVTFSTKHFLSLIEDNEGVDDFLQGSLKVMLQSTIVAVFDIVTGDSEFAEVVFKQDLLMFEDLTVSDRKSREGTKARFKPGRMMENVGPKDHFVGCLNNGLPACSKSIDGMFNVFNPIRKFSTDAINRFCEFIGARIVFWDLRDSFLFHLYRGSVENARLESNLPQIDIVLDHICSVIANPLRDLVVLSIYRSFLDGYIWVLLDGGPSRVFSDVDVEVMHEDIKILKGFFIADEEGLPPAVIDYETRLPLEILHLYSLQTEILIEMLMSASEKISSKADSRKPDEYCMDDAYTLLRVLCHKKDTEASKFLKMHYELPKSSEYEDNALEFAVSSTLLTDLLKRSASFQWTKNSRRSFKSIKKKLREATSEIMH
ncbi:hypothetical protein Sjap_004974 [Stephania japonica]|uniref:MHD2 domain-containing protein n=1 Tax=Stephania japonica TaxID=461633 RepID=A0AAP0K3F2_9MAGN